MKNYSLLLLAAGLPFFAGAIDLAQTGVDLTFAERYAFATNRAEVIATLQPETSAWYTYSILNAQTEGRLADAKDLIERGWRKYLNLYDFFHRQNFLAFDPAKPRIGDIRNTLADCGIKVEPRNREVALAPNTYPADFSPQFADRGKSWEYFWEKCGGDHGYEPNFKFLYMYPDLVHTDWFYRVDPRDEKLLPDTPGLEHALIEYLRNGDHRRYGEFCDRGIYRKLTLDQLTRLAEKLKGSKSDLYGNRDYATIVLRKLSAGAEDDFDTDPAAEKALLERKVAFVRGLKPSLNAVKAQVYAEMLGYGRRHGEEPSLKDVFKDYLTVKAADRRPSPRPYQMNELTDLVRDYLAAFRRAGSDLSEYADLIEEKARVKFLAAVDLLSGRAAEAVNAKVLSAEEFKGLRDRVDLCWSPTNPTLFAADDDVKLSLEVKNVPRLLVSIYELDAFEACRTVGGEVALDIDLDGAVPTATRKIDYSRYAAMVRHSETLELPELKRPGLYVVECSGAGICSRALVRKGRLRVTERRDGAGHVFTALDEQGRVVKGTKLRLGETVFLAESNGEIPVPFAADEKSAGRKCVVVGDGRLASTLNFEHVAETVTLDMALVLPSEALVAGRRATALLRPTLRVSGTLAPLELLKDAQLSLVFTDLDDHSVTHPYPELKLADDAETEVSFVVPPRMASVAFKLTGKVRKATDGENVSLEKTVSTEANGVCRTDKIPQHFLRRTKSGYVIEMRGRTGEPLVARAVTVELKHRAFRVPTPVMLQTDEAGCVRLGALPDIESVRVGDERWSLSAPRTLPEALSVAEGEAIELPFRDLLAGEWPGAGRLDVRVSLLSRAANGEITADCLSACSYTNGVLRLTDLTAGDYSLTLRDRAETCAIHVVKTAAGVGEGGVLASAARAVTDVGSPDRLRIVAANLATNGVLSVQLANITPSARVHLFASRTVPNADAGVDPVFALAAALEKPTMREGKWGRKTTEYVSGRDLGERLRYVLDRRDQPARIGNLLDRPSLLLNPWEVSETTTVDGNLRAGEGWRENSAPGDIMQELNAPKPRAPVREPQTLDDYTPCYDFLPQAATVVANVRPDEKGVVMIDLAAAGEVGLRAQDFTVVVTDGYTLDTAHLLGEPTAYVPRDLRYVRQVAADGTVAQPPAKTIETVSELFDLLKPDGGFYALRAWATKTMAEKRELYDEYASHELDFFLYEQDHPFFDTVVKPHLANKRQKRFVDKWLLGEDVSSYAMPGAIDNLNVFEQCLLARRMPKVAEQIARRYADWCAAHPEDSESIDDVYDRIENLWEGDSENKFSLYGTSFFERLESAEEDDAGAPGMKMEAAGFGGGQIMREQMNADVEVGRSRRVRAPQAALMKVGKSVAARRANRQLYRPPKRTREWVESHYYHRRANEPTKYIVEINPFWRDYAAAIVAGTTDTFASENILFVADGCDTQGILALALIKRPVTFVRPKLPSSGALQVTERYYDAADPEKVVTDEFVVGRPYFKKTVLMNPTDEEIYESFVVEIPEGAIPLNGDRAVGRHTVPVDELGATSLKCTFYFPQVVDGAPLPVVAAPTKTDTTSWAYVSQNGTKGEVLDYLKTKNLAMPEVDLAKIAWRMKDGQYARQVLDVLTARGFYDQELWLAGLLWREAFDAQRLREVLAREENLKRVAQKLGPALDSPLLTIDPETAGIFEHKEYWPIINARAHAVAGGVDRLANRQLAAEYRAFLDTLAAKRTLSANDRLLAAVYLIAQDRIEEAKAQVAEVKAEDVETKMQVAYLGAYLAFCDGDAEKGRALAAPYADHPVPHWQKRFREVIAQADEIAGKVSVTADAEAVRAPTLALAFADDTAVLTARNLATCTLKVYPTDPEILFTKDPFRLTKKTGDTVRCLKPAWSMDVALTNGETRVTLPAAVRARPLVLVASGAEGRAEASLAVVPRVLDVQVSREYRQLRVRGADGRPLAGTYVKVYVRDASGRTVKFHKDGYTDLRGVFDYASVSTDTDFKPAEYAILVLHASAGVKTLTVAE